MPPRSPFRKIAKIAQDPLLLTILNGLPVANPIVDTRLSLLIKGIFSHGIIFNRDGTILSAVTPDGPLSGTVGLSASQFIGEALIKNALCGLGQSTGMNINLLGGKDFDILAYAMNNQLLGANGIVGVLVLLNPMSLSSLSS